MAEGRSSSRRGSAGRGDHRALVSAPVTGAGARGPHDPRVRAWGAAWGWTPCEHAARPAMGCDGQATHVCGYAGTPRSRAGDRWARSAWRPNGRADEIEVIREACG